MDDLLAAGLDGIPMDRQANMGLGLMGRRFGCRIAFFSPVDIRNMMVAQFEPGIISEERLIHAHS